MQNLSKKSLHKLATKGLSKDTFIKEVGEDIEYYLELWHSQGVSIVKKEGLYFFETKCTPISEAVFCIVDIETNGSKLTKHQIIEIAALKIKNNTVIDRFETLVQCESINKAITQITGICVEDTTNAPSLQTTMYKFKEFLADAVFVAHDVEFDYNFISGTLKNLGLLPLLNRKLCSIDIAQRTLQSYRYGLKYLNEY